MFVYQDNTLRSEYDQGWKIIDIMPANSSGIVTARDALTIHETREKLWQVIQDFVSLHPEDAREKYDLRKDVRDWQVKLAQQDVRASGNSKDKIQRILYRPFDIRHTYYTGNCRGIHCRPRPEIMRHMISGKNVGLITVRQVAEDEFNHALAVDSIFESRITFSSKGAGYLFPLYLYPGKSLSSSMIDSQRRPNFSLRFLAALSNALDLPQSDDHHLPANVSPEDIFGYIYAVLHSPEYRCRYRDFLCIDFPRIPLPKSLRLFRQLAAIGNELVSLHLLNHPDLQSPAV